MGGGSGLIDGELQLTPASNNTTRTVVLVGRTGNGKSATGNSIIGRKAFRSTISSAGVTETCQLETRVLADGSRLNVIDTPGLFDFTDGGSEAISKEIVRCIDLAKDGLHAVLIVFSVRTRFSQEEEAALLSLQAIFGSNIVNYMIIVFSGGDDLEDMDMTLDTYLGQNCPPPLKDIVALCENRVVLFNNKTDNDIKKAAQFQQLSTLVNIVTARNNGIPFTDELFTLRNGAIKLRGHAAQLDAVTGYSKDEIDELKDQMQKMYEEQLKATTQMIEIKHREIGDMLQKQLSMELEERAKAEERAMEAERRFSEELARMQIEQEIAFKMLEMKLSEEQTGRLVAENAASAAKQMADNIQKELHNVRLEVEQLRNKCVIL